ncbi:MAG TPA: ATP-binding protein [Alphaproteobacteria bacterium]|nr:ATP-binding protein [Alphaproteobacteria bacterium]
MTESRGSQGGTAASSASRSLQPEALRRCCDPASLPFESTAELPDLDDAIGQVRAAEAVRFGIGIKRPGFNIFALGPSGVGKEHLVRRGLKTQAAREPVPDDWCYVNNFIDAHKPVAMRLPAGRAMPFRRDMERLVNELMVAIPAAFEGEEYRHRREVIEEELKQRQGTAFEALQRKALDKSVGLIRTPMGLALAPLKGGEVVKPEDFEKLDEAERTRIQSDIEALQGELQTLFRQIPVWERETREKLRALHRDVVSYAVGHLIDEPRQRYRDLPVVSDYLASVQADVIDNAEVFMRRSMPQEADGPGPMPGMPALGPDALFRRYQVNVIVANVPDSGAPVIFEDHPSLENLVGRIEHISQFGALVTDFNLIKGGSLHRANGGYLVLDARRLLVQPFAWEELKRALRSRLARIQSMGQLMSLVSTVSLEPGAIPLDVKIVLLGDRLLYYLLSQYDPDFHELFKVPADFDDRIAFDPDGLMLYARMIATLARREKLRPLDRSAVARVIEHASRVAEDSERLTANLEGIADLVREADFWAGEGGAGRIAAEHVERAIEAHIRRADRVREHVQEEIRRGTILIDTAGAVVGQVNGLSVMQLGDFAFGQPSRITARVRLGRGQVVDIEREVELGGPIHSKGVLILSSYLAARYAAERPLSLNASLVFEQSYGGVEGDSASSAELYALLSALAAAPIRQSLAVTGSVNQLGQVQAIGGVNEKIEGFFDVCRAAGLLDGHGVLIPASNVKHLMLRRDVIEAVAAGTFHIYAVERIDQGIEILTGIAAGAPDAKGSYPPDSINGRVEARLAGFAEAARRFAQQGRDRGDEGPAAH